MVNDLTTPARIATASQLPTPTLYRCRLTHRRHQKVPHTFTYTVYLWLVDLDERPESKVFPSFAAADHLGDPDHSIRANVEAFLGLHGVRVGGSSRILMLAQPRCAGYAFDPITFFFCYPAADEPPHVIAEVRNTFGERHCYLLRPDSRGRAEVAKQLYVSPYFPVDGGYDMRIALNAAAVSVSVILRRPKRHHPKPPLCTALADERALTVVLIGRAVHGRLRFAAAIASPRHVFAAVRTIALIHWQAGKLRRRGLTPARRRRAQSQPGVTR